MSQFDDWEEFKTAEEEAADLEQRRDVLGYALANGPREPRRYGIHAFEVCQQCGEIGSYSGLWGAVGSHGSNGTRKKDHPLPPGAFIASRHDHGKLTLERGQRFCEICRNGVRSEDADKVGYCVLCRLCSRAVRKHGTDEQLWPMLKRFTRYRWRYHGLIEDQLWDRGRFF